MTSFLPILLAANKYRIIDYDFPVVPFGSMKIPAGPAIILLLIAASIAAVLQFMIVASDDKDIELFEVAKQQAASKDSNEKSEKLSRAVIDPQTREAATGKKGMEREIGYWAKLVRDKGDEKTAPFRGL